MYQYINIITCQYLSFKYDLLSYSHGSPNTQCTLELLIIILLIQEKFVLVLDFMSTSTYMSSQIEVRVVCEVDWCWFCRRGSHIQNEFIIGRQLVCGLYQNMPWVTLLATFAEVCKCHLVTINMWLPQCLQPCRWLNVCCIVAVPILLHACEVQTSIHEAGIDSGYSPNSRLCQDNDAYSGTTLNSWRTTKCSANTL